MENPINDVSVGTSPTTSAESSNSNDSLAGLSFKEAAMKYSEQRESERESQKATNPDNANFEEGDSETPEKSEDSSRAEKKESIDSPGVKRRIDGLTAKYKAEQTAHREAALENAKLKEAVKLYEQELARVSGFAKLDPHQEKIRQLELEREIDQIERRIPGEIEGRFAESEQQMVLQERAAEIADSLRAETANWEGLFRARELAMYMKSTGNLDVASAARKLGEGRLSAAQKRMKGPQAPATAAGNTAGSREAARPWKYEGSGSILDFMEQEDRARRGR